MIWFSSDHHFNHENVIRYCNRPFSSVDEMTEVMVARWNELVDPDDTVYYLGDFSLSRQAVRSVLPRLFGYKHLIPGNHDHCHPINFERKPAKGNRLRAEYFDAGFLTICVEHCLRIADHHVLIHHMPYRSLEPGPHGEKYAEWRPVDHGAWLLHGHVHQRWRQRGRMINVGVDVWDYRPVPIDKIAEMISAGSQDDPR